MTTTSTLPNYGALPLPGDNNDAADTPFDPDNTYYLKDTSRWTTRKVVSIAVPILAAMMVMGGIALFLLKDFNHLYPGRGGDKSPFYSNSGGVATPKSSSSDTKSPVAFSTTKQHHDSTTPASSPSKNKVVYTVDAAGASCAVHPDCSLLSGNCCPTAEGLMLACC